MDDLNFRMSVEKSSVPYLSCVCVCVLKWKGGGRFDSISFTASCIRLGKINSKFVVQTATQDLESPQMDRITFNYRNSICTI